MARLLLSILIIGLSGCVRWEPTPLAPVSYFAQDTADRARVSLQGGAPITVDNLTLRGDSLVGILPGSSAPGHPPQPFSVPVDQVQSVRLPQHPLFATIGAVLLGLTGTVVTVYLFGS